MRELHAYTNQRCLEHRLFPGFLEKPERLQALLTDVFNEQSGFVLHEYTAPASVAALTTAHTPAYVQQVARLSFMNPVLAVFCQMRDKRLQWYTRVGPGSFMAARYAAGTVLQAVKDVASGDVTRAFCALRPPGHHAGPERGEGFCLFNNVAIGAIAARKAGFERVAIVDFDRHHGNGTEAIVANQNDAGLLFISSYQEGCKYAGAAPAAGSVHVPIPSRGGYEAVSRLYENTVIPKLREFGPDLLMFSAGFDMHRSDPLSSIRLEAADYYDLTRHLAGAAEGSTKGRVVSVLEGGYGRPALVQCVRQHLAALRAE